MYRLGKLLIIFYDNKIKYIFYFILCFTYKIIKLLLKNKNNTTI